MDKSIGPHLLAFEFILPTVLRCTVGKNRQCSTKEKTVVLQTASGINISAKTECWELCGVGFHARAAPVGVMRRWPSNIFHVVDQKIWQADDFGSSDG